MPRLVASSGKVRAALFTAQGVLMALKCHTFTTFGEGHVQRSRLEALAKNRKQCGGMGQEFA